MTALLALLAIFSTHVLAIPLCGLIAFHLGSMELMPWVFAAGCLVVGNWREMKR